jgi:hypothetical protein
MVTLIEKLPLLKHEIYGTILGMVKEEVEY